MRISDWSSDVCSSDLRDQFNDAVHARNRTHFVANLVTQTATLCVVGSPAVDEHRRRFLPRSEEHTSELQSLMRISYAVFCLKKKNKLHSSIQVPEYQQHLLTNKQLSTRLYH